MKFYIVIALGVLNAISLRGSKVAVSLYALELGASGWTVGVLAALYSALPLFLAVSSGRIIDRIGTRTPMIAGSFCVTAGMLAPYANPTLGALVLCPTLAGLGHMLYLVALQALVGSYGTPADRTRNFGTFSLGQSLAAFIGPFIAGTAIDHVGAPWTFGIFAGIAIVPATVFLAAASLCPPRRPAAEEAGSKRALDLLANPPLRRAIVMSAVTLTAVELLTFYFPIYGHSIGMSASWIGAVLSAYAAAGFLVRMVMPRLAERHGEMVLLTASLFVSGAVFLVMPAFESHWVLASLAFVLGLGLGSAQPLTTILTFNHSPQYRNAEAMGLRIMVNRLTQLAVPLVFGGMSAATGVRSVFVANALFLLAGGALSWKDQRKRRQP